MLSQMQNQGCPPEIEEKLCMRNVLYSELTLGGAKPVQLCDTFPFSGFSDD